ncbi:unnamed protein product [Spirodela intermedia]|uniref:Uncharacterized protein n=1 Tax=Spirodela intermedia TaxID=51605 RepID=A0A7I8JEY5_SPIIN|nr:unnamed protein product [Spirodela intermedia]CAA6668315.1 unnamed protein product [Spirodela intermedia]
MSRTRWILDRTEDLELRLAPSFMSKGGTLTNNLFRSYPPNIIILDDDDDHAEEEDRQIYSSELSGPTRNLLHYSSSWAPELSEQDLELRLGLGVVALNPLYSTPLPHFPMHTCSPISEKTDPGEEIHARLCSCCAAPYGEEVKLRCAICMDTMKEETSTICGHKKCPACRMKLSLQHIHRIYLPGSNP